MNIKWLLLFFFIRMNYITSQRKVKITVTSINCALAHHCTDCGSEIRINNKQRSQKMDGINIVIIDPFNGQVITSASFSNTHSRLFNDFLNDIKLGYIAIATSQLSCLQNKTTDLHKQKSILYAFQKLGATIPTYLQPVLFSSGVYIYCKQHCYDEFQANVNLPYGDFKKTDEDPVLLYFTMNTLPCLNQLGCKTVETTRKPTDNRVDHRITLASRHHNKEDGISLMVIAYLSPLLVVGLISLSIFLYIRHRYKQDGVSVGIIRKKKNSEKSNPKEKPYLNNNAIRFCECRKNMSLLPDSASDTNPLVTTSVDSDPVSLPKVKHTSSFRLFHKKNNVTHEDYEHVNFATYIAASDLKNDVIEEHADDCIYKVPSSIRRHAPPDHLPPNCGNINSEETKEYMDFSHHDYESLCGVEYIESPENILDSSDSDVFRTPENSNGEKIDLTSELVASLSGYNKAKQLYERASSSLSAMSSSHLTCGLETLPSNEYEDFVTPMYSRGQQISGLK